jgi:hypothetical protein
VAFVAAGLGAGSQAAVRSSAMMMSGRMVGAVVEGRAQQRALMWNKDCAIGGGEPVMQRSAARRT